MATHAVRAKVKRREELLLAQIVGTDDERRSGKMALQQLFLEYLDTRTDKVVRREMYFFVFGHFGVPPPDELDAKLADQERDLQLAFSLFKQYVLAKWSSVNHKLWVHCLVWGLYGNANTHQRVTSTFHRLLFAKVDDDYMEGEKLRKRAFKRRYRDAGNGLVYNEDGTKRVKRIFRCSLCGSTSHNKRRCGRTADSETVTVAASVPAAGAGAGAGAGSAPAATPTAVSAARTTTTHLDSVGVASVAAAAKAAAAAAGGVTPTSATVAVHVPAPSEPQQLHAPASGAPSLVR